MNKKAWLCALLFFQCAFAQVDHTTHWHAKDYHFHSEEQFQVAKQIVENLPLRGNETVLDIGCGDGKITAMIQARLQGGRAVGVDISPSMVTYAREIFPHIEFEQKDAHFINYDHEFDLVVSFTTMQWVTHQTQALQRIHKALKKGGKVIIEMPQGLPKPLKDAVEEVMSQSRWQKYFINYIPNWRFYECDEYRSLMEDVGFEIESLTSREVTHLFPSKQAFTGFLQQWFPYLSQLSSDEDKSLFLEQVVDRYLKALNLSGGEVPFTVRRLNTIATSNEDKMSTALINGKTYFYQDRGKGCPLLLGHSYLWTSDMWEPQLNALSKEFRCIAVDLWDHGASGSLNEREYTVEHLADDYWQLMQFLGIPEFAVVGLSVGGMWGAHLALEHPEAVRALVLMDTFVGAEPQATKQKYLTLLDILEKERCFTDALMTQIVPLFFSPHTLTHQKQLVETFKKSLKSVRAENIPGIVTLGRAIFSRNSLLDKLSSITQPTLVLVGKDDIPRPPREAEEMARLIPNARLEVIDRAGHISNLEQPETVTPILLDFLRKHITERSFNH